MACQPISGTIAIMGAARKRDRGIWLIWDETAQNERFLEQQPSQWHNTF
jgi:hypothetical protein